MKPHVVAKGSAKEASPGLSKRIARFAMAINGCSAQDVSKSYWKQAKREFLGELDTDPKEAVLASAPDSESWHPVPGLTGHNVPVARHGLQAG